MFPFPFCRRQAQEDSNNVAQTLTPLNKSHVVMEGIVIHRGVGEEKGRKAAGKVCMWVT